MQEEVVTSSKIPHEGSRPEQANNRRVFTTAMMTDEDAERITASLPTLEEVRSGRYVWQHHMPSTDIDKHDQRSDAAGRNAKAYEVIRVADASEPSPASNAIDHESTSMKVDPTGRLSRRPCTLAE
jgi:hypothetical protein